MSLQFKKSVLFIGMINAFFTPTTFANMAYINGHIYTGEQSQKFVSSMIVVDGKFSYVGNKPNIEQLDDNFKIIDLKGKTVVPGLYDSHVHPIGAGEKLIFECQFPQQANSEEILKKVAECVQTMPETSWIVGGSWGTEILDEMNRPTIAMLDKVSNGRPVVLTDFSHHNVWANSKAIELSGLTQNQLDSFGNLVVRDNDGELSGFFLEQAGRPISDSVPKRLDSDYVMAAKRAISELNKVGIIGVKDSYVFSTQYKAWKTLDESGALNANVGLSWGWPSAEGLTQTEKQVHFLEMVKPSTGHLYANFAKITLDGIPPTKTAAMLTPYHPVEEHLLGSMGYSQENLNKTLEWLDSHGYTTQVHAVGDRAARTVLNAVEHVRESNGESGLRHEIAHACIVDPVDIERFSEINVVANFSPIFWYPSPIQDGLEMVLGKERATRNCEIKTLIENGSMPTGGSDWPVSTDVNPWKAIESMITRQDPNGLRMDQTLWPEQRINIEQALEIYTINGAKALRIDENSGSIKVGKSADMLIIDRDVFSVDAASIGETKVLTTIFEGNVVSELAIE